MLSNKEIRAKSRADMKNKYGYAILTTILLNLILVGSGIAGFGLGAIVVVGAVMCCYNAFYIDIAMGGNYCGVDSTFRGFRQFMRAFVATLLLVLINLAVVLAGGILLLIYVGICGGHVGDFAAIGLFLIALAAICVDIWINVRLSMAFYVMNHNVSLSATDCLKQSWVVTKGHFWKIIGLKLSFLGWIILVGLTGGILAIYVIPYMGTADANLYLTLAYPDGNYPEFDENGEIVVKENVAQPEAVVVNDGETVNG